MRCFWFLVLFLLAALRPAVAQEKIVFDVKEYGGWRLIGGELYKPQGVGLHPTVILLHGCGGITPTSATGLRGSRNGATSP